MLKASIIKEVGEWSGHNFGSQVCKKTATELGYHAPLMGMGEELGELAEALSKQGYEDKEELEEAIVDAVGDMGIYLCDFCYRIGIAGPVLAKPMSQAHKYRTGGVGLLVQSLGKLNHTVLKGAQGIRGYDNPQYYSNELNESIANVLDSLITFCQQNLPSPFEMILDATWAGVCHRDWTKNAQTGN